MDAAFDGPDDDEDEEEGGERRGLLGRDRSRGGEGDTGANGVEEQRGRVPGDYDFQRDYVSSLSCFGLETDVCFSRLASLFLANRRGGR